MQTTEKTTGLGARVRRPEDLEEIRHLMARYANATSKGGEGRAVEVQQMPSIFMGDAVWEGPNQHLEGLDNIIENLRSVTAPIDCSAHVFANPVIDVDGDVARGRFLLSIVSNRGGGDHQGQESEEVTFARTVAGWRIRTVRLLPGQFFPLPEYLA